MFGVTGVGHWREGGRRGGALAGGREGGGVRLVVLWGEVEGEGEVGLSVGWWVGGRVLQVIGIAIVIAIESPIVVHSDAVVLRGGAVGTGVHDLVNRAVDFVQLVVQLVVVHVHEGR